MLYIAMLLLGFIIGFATLYILRTRQVKKKMSPTQKMTLEAVEELVKTGHLYVNREQVSKKMGINPYTAFNLMDALEERGYLERDGWTFTVSDQGFTFLQGQGPFAEQLNSVWPTRGDD